MPQRMDSMEKETAAAETADPAALLVENQLLQDKLLRALAEAENVRRRSERAIEDVRQYAVSGFAREMLSVADNLRRAVMTGKDHPPASREDEALLEGVQTTERMLIQSLERFGVRRIEALGAQFDPALHEAVMEIDDPAQEPGRIVQVVEEGYMIADRLLRPARVVVVRRRTGSAPSV